MAGKAAKTERGDSFREHRERVAAEMIEALERGTAPWQKPWNGELVRPRNATTNEPYRGGNVVWLMHVQNVRGWTDPRWCTYRQAQQMRYGTFDRLTEKEFERNKALPPGHPDRTPTWQVRRGEKGTWIERWFTAGGNRDRDAEREHPVDETQGVEKGQRSRLFCRHFSVFSGQQIDGMPAMEIKVADPAVGHDRVDQIIANSGAVVGHGGDQAYYAPGLDVIQMPPPAAFHSPELYYASLLHEHGHWTGHPSRLARPELGQPFGSEAYAREELRVEIASMFLAEETGVKNDPSRHASYVASWVKAIRNDPNAVFQAATEAHRIADYIMSFEFERRIEREPRMIAQPSPALSLA